MTELELWAYALFFGGSFLYLIWKATWAEIAVKSRLK